MNAGALFVLLGVLLLCERLAKHVLVRRYFRRPAPSPGPEPELISVLQPVVSGDPALAGVLERSLLARSRFRRETLWLADDDDSAAIALCTELAARHPGATTRILRLPQPPDGASPKMFKLIHGAREARGDVLCVLDDDTALPDDAFELCLPYLEGERVGLAFGLPYYESFDGVWSSLVACFVNRNALATYLPHVAWVEPFTINGMFYVLKRTTYAALGGFDGLERWATDDFAVAQHVRAHGLRLAQTPVLHPIRTTVAGPRHYLRLLQRWFVFPRETLYRGLAPRELAVVYGLAFAPAVGPLVFLAGLIVAPSAALVAVLGLYVLHDLAFVAEMNVRWQRRAMPWRWLPLVLVTDFLLPFQVLFALLAPQEVDWRGNRMRIHRGGGFEYLRRARHGGGAR